MLAIQRVQNRDISEQVYPIKFLVEGEEKEEKEEEFTILHCLELQKPDTTVLLKDIKNTKH